MWQYVCLCETGIEKADTNAHWAAICNSMPQFDCLVKHKGVVLFPWYIQPQSPEKKNPIWGVQPNFYLIYTYDDDDDAY